MNTKLNLNNFKQLPEAVVFRHLRMSSGLRVRDLANMIGISHTLICHYESGYQKIPDHRIKDLCTIFKVSESTLKDFQEGHKDLPVIYKDQCMLLLNKMTDEQLKTVHVMLTGLSRN